MSTYRKPLVLNLTTTDSDENHALILRQLRAAASRTTVLSARVSVSVRDRVQTLARRWGTTPSRVLGAVVTLLSASGADPSEKLAAVAELLGIPGASAEAIVTAVGALADAVDPVPADTAPADPLAAHPDSPANPFAPTTKLSREDLAAMTPAERGRYQIEADAARRARRAAGDKPLASNLATRKR